MKTKLIARVICAVITASVLTYGGLSINENAQLLKEYKQLNTGLNTQVEDLDSQLEKVTQEKDEAFKEGKRLLDENQKLKQEIENLKSLKAAAESRGIYFSRGNFGYVVYDEYSRVDVPSDISSKQLDLALEGTGLEGLGTAFVQAEIDNEINALFLTAIAALESGWGESEFSIYRNNIFGYGSYDYDLDNTYYYASKGEGIAEVAREITSDYLTEGGEFYGGSATPAGVNVLYSSSSLWDSKVVSIMNTLVDRATR